jgi:hypothetical protein
MNCPRCGWPLLESQTRCVECLRLEVFRLCARIVGRSILAQPNWLLRVQLIRKFFGVAVDTWEQMRLFGPVQSAKRR